MDNQLDRQLLLQLAGELRATRHVLLTLIGTLPTVDGLRAALTRQLPELGDELIEGSHPTSEQEREGWKRALSATSRMLDLRAQLDAGG